VRETFPLQDLERRNSVQIFYVFECRKERVDGTWCGWSRRVGERRVPMGESGRRAEEIDDFCKRCRRQGRVEEGERCTFYFLRRETGDRRIIEDVVFVETD